MEGVAGSSGSRTWRRRAVSVEAAAFAGVAFVVLYALSLLLIGDALPGWSESSGELAASLEDSGARSSLLFGYALTPFAAIAFLWFVAVIHRRIPPADRFITVVFISGSTLFVALFLVATSVVAAPYYMEEAEGVEILDPETLRALQSVAWTLMFVVATRIQVLVVLAATAAGRQHGVFPRWLVLFGYLIAVVQILNLTLFEPLIFTFPLWVLAVSLTLAIRRDALPVQAAGGGEVP